MYIQNATITLEKTPFNIYAQIIITYVLLMLLLRSLIQINNQ